MTTKRDTDMMNVSQGVTEATDYTDLLQTNFSDAFAFSDVEKRVLELYDQLLELELEHNLLQSHSGKLNSPAQDQDILALSDDELQEQLTRAQQEAMEAKTEYEIRNRVQHGVLVMDPVLKAVHGGERTGYAEKRILPFIRERDTMSMVHNSQTSRLGELQRATTIAEGENLVANQRNRELSATMLALAEQMKAQSAKDIEDPNLRKQVEEVEKELKESRRRMKTLKGIISAMIVGSGINWAADGSLTELVMDEEDD